MNLCLHRTELGPEGIFGVLTFESGAHIAYTLEHAYAVGSDWLPKIPNGEFTCVRGNHRLAGLADPFETFEVTGVPGHFGILFHIGNYNKNSEGCVLLGTEILGYRLVSSLEAFNNFMKCLSGINSFQLAVT